LTPAALAWHWGFAPFISRKGPQEKPSGGKGSPSRFSGKFKLMSEDKAIYESTQTDVPGEAPASVGVCDCGKVQTQMDRDSGACFECGAPLEPPLPGATDGHHPEIEADPTSIENAARTVVALYYGASNTRDVDSAMRELRMLLGWDTFKRDDLDCCACPECDEDAGAGHGFADDDGHQFCAACELSGCTVEIARCAGIEASRCAKNCPGWGVFNARPEDGYLGEIQSCDTCSSSMSMTDEAAVLLARAMGFVVSSDTYEIEAYPKGWQP
jgi:hypothetical protein